MKHRIYISSSSPQKENTAWGDFHFVQHLGEALKKNGAKVRIVGLSEKISTRNTPVILRIAGPHLPDPVPGAINLAWFISHPELCIPDILQEFDGIYVASRSHTEWVSKRTLKTRVRFLQQATKWHTNSEHMLSLKKRKKEAIFVGNARGHEIRRIVSLALEAKIPFKVIGNNWSGIIPDHHILRKFVNNNNLPKIYGRHLVALNDHWASMKPAGFVNNRVFDTLACGAIPICDDVELADPELSALVLQVTNAQEMKEAFEAACHFDNTSYERMILTSQALIAEKYSFDTVARILIDEISIIFDEKPTARTTLNPPLITHCNGWVDWTDCGPEKEAFARIEQNETGISQGALASASLIHESEINDGPEVSLANRVLRIVNWVEEHYFYKKPFDFYFVTSNMVDGRGFHPMPINEMTATYKESIDLALHLGKNIKNSGTIKSLTDCMNIAKRYLARRQFFDPQNNLAEYPFPHNLASRRLNDLYSYPGYSLENVGRDFCKPFVRMPVSSVDDNRTTGFAVVIHAYHIEILEGILKRVPFFADVPILISTNSEKKSLIISEILDDFRFTRYEIRIFENRGRDIYPKVFGFQDILDKYELFLFLHTKKSEYTESYSDWLPLILDDIATNEGVVARILSLFRDIPDLGLLFPRPHHGLSSHLWGTNREIARELANRIGIGSLPQDGTFRFPAGSMFWARSEVIKSIARLDLKATDFPPERGQLDGTPAHAIERLVGIIPRAIGLKTLCFSGKDDHRYKRFCEHFETNNQVRNYLRKQKI